GFDGGDGDVNRFGIQQLYERITHEGLRGESAATDEAGGIDRIGDGGVDGIEARFGAGNGDAVGHDLDIAEAIAGGEGADHARRNSDRLRGTPIELEANLRRHDLDDMHIVRHVTDLLRSEIEGMFADLGSGEINDGVDIDIRHLAKDAGRTLDANFGTLDTFGADLEMFGRVVELDGNGERDFRRLIVSDGVPERDGDEERKELEAEVSEDMQAEPVDHRSISEESSSAGRRPLWSAPGSRS